MVALHPLLSAFGRVFLRRDGRLDGGVMLVPWTSENIWGTRAGSIRELQVVPGVRESSHAFRRCALETVRRCGGLI
jgi:hypothetical protein